MAQRHAAQGEEHLKAAKKALKTSMFKWSPDHMTAAHSFERAAASFRLSQDYERACTALTHSAEEHYKLGNTLQSALILEKAAESAMQSVKKSKETIALALSLFERATYRFRESGDLGKASGCLVKSARVLVNKPEGDTQEDKQKALGLYAEACDLLRGSGKESVNLDVFRNGFSLAVSAGDISYADVFNTDLIAISLDLGQSGGVNKCFLNMIILRLASGDVVAARQEFESHFDDTGFLKSDEADAAENLLRAFDSNDDDEVKAIVKKNVVFRFLDHQVTKLARQLNPLKGSLLAAPSSVKAAVQQTPSPSPPPVAPRPYAATAAGAGASAASAGAGVGFGATGAGAGAGIGIGGAAVMSAKALSSSLSSSEALFQVAGASKAPKAPQQPKNDNDSMLAVKAEETISEIVTSSDATEQPHAVVNEMAVAVEGLNVTESTDAAAGAGAGASAGAGADVEEEEDSMEAMMQAAREAALDMAKQEEQNDHDDDLDFLK